MALADKQYERIFSTTGSDGDKIDNSKFARIKSKFDNNEYLEDDDSFETLAPLLYQIQKMQDELDEIRRHVVNDVVGSQGPQGATGPQGPAGAKGDTGDTGARGATGAAGEALRLGEDALGDDAGANAAEAGPGTNPIFTRWGHNSCGDQVLLYRGIAATKRRGHMGK